MKWKILAVLLAALALLYGCEKQPEESQKLDERIYIKGHFPIQGKALAGPDGKHPKHLILKAPHPSPLSAYRGFFGSRPFSKTNEFLKEHGIEPIDWQIENI